MTFYRLTMVKTAAGTLQTEDDMDGSIPRQGREGANDLAVLRKLWLIQGLRSTLLGLDIFFLQFTLSFFFFLFFLCQLFLALLK